MHSPSLQVHNRVRRPGGDAHRKPGRDMNRAGVWRFTKIGGDSPQHIVFHPGEENHDPKDRISGRSIDPHVSIVRRILEEIRPPWMRI